MTDESFELRFPFELQPSYTLKVDSPISLAVPDLDARLSSASSGYQITVRGLASEEASEKAVLPRVFTGLTNLMLECKSAFTASFDLERPTRLSGPPGGEFGKQFPAARGLASSGVPLIVRSDEKIVMISTGQIQVSVSTPAQLAAGALERGMSVEHAGSLMADTRFRTAVELLAAAQFEASESARLFTTAMVLEVLAPSQRKPKIALNLLATWRDSVVAARREVVKDSEDFYALEALDRELLFREEASIRSRIRALVLSALASRTGVRDLAKEAVWAYDQRSKLVHEGRLDPPAQAQAAEALRRIGELIVASRLFPGSTGTPPAEGHAPPG